MKNLFLTEINGNKMILRQLKDEISFRTTDGVLTGSIINLASNTIGTILTLTPIVNQKVVKISCSGGVYAKFQVFIDNNLIETKITGPKRHVVFKYDYPIPLNIGQILDIKVTHFYTGEQVNFDGTIYSIT